jgi:hypothetical protein
MRENTIYLRRRQKVLLLEGTSQLPEATLAAFLKNLERLGYTLSPSLIATVQTLSNVQVKAFHDALVADIRAMVGAHVQYKPMYPNFPEQVMKASSVELYLNAIFHYIGAVFGARVMPHYVTEARPERADKIKLKIIDLGTIEEFEGIFRNLIASKTSLSATDKEDVAWVVAKYGDSVKVLLPDVIPLKENVGLVGNLLLKHTTLAPTLLPRYIKTATDVLRLAVALSDGDVSLATNTKFRSFKRAERRVLLGLLESIPNITEDMNRYAKVWIRLGERLHPGEFGDKYPQVNAAFHTLRNGLPIVTLNSQVETGLVQKDTQTVAKLLTARPGDFARRLDHLLRIGDTKNTLAAFASVASQVSTPVLLQVRTHFSTRMHPPIMGDLRTFFPKGDVGKLQAIDNTLPALSETDCARVGDVCEAALRAKFGEKEALGKVYVDTALKNYLVPFSQRSASKALRTLVRGSQLPLETERGNTIRFFLWWKEGKMGNKETGQVDIDLSAVLYDANWQYKEHLSYTNLRSAQYKACHSGDITSAPDGACEFIDLDIPSVVAYGGRYIVMSLFAYSHHPYCELPECFAGWMMRKEPQSGEIFDPQTVIDKVDIVSDTRICIPVILDVLTRKVIWCDLALRKNPKWQNALEANQNSMALLGRAITTLQKPNLYDLFSLHATARGVLVENKADADTVFSVTEGITPFETETIMGEYL